MDGPTANVEDHAFIQMRDKTASKTFRAKKKLDHLLEAALPGIYLRFTRWSLSRGFIAPMRRVARASRIGLFTAVSLRSRYY